MAEAGDREELCHALQGSNDDSLEIGQFGHEDSSSNIGGRAGRQDAGSGAHPEQDYFYTGVEVLHECRR
jgi:hypothetical protein